ncbi:MAG: hypothetical protein N838_08325 [Thiohalocapsa sp. PB-PSB1]|jgi:diguanylate cyclase (GGDEF)-like protein|nr:MAG: hypothetical protein N838_08325 [Thiohalocapsa sp. PB-PSB1]
MIIKDLTRMIEGYLSLRWKALIGLSIVLALVNTSLAFFSYTQLADQFEWHQTLVRDRQAKQLQALLNDRYQQMSRLANVVPLLVAKNADETLEEHLQRALNTNGVMLDLEWDIHSVHWIKLNGQIQLLWPQQAQTLPATLSAQVAKSPDETARLLACANQCRQFLAAPLLWQGQSSGALVLGRSVADALLAFHALTGAEAAVLPSASAIGKAKDGVQFKAITHPEITRPLFERALYVKASTDEPSSTEIADAGQPTTITVLADSKDWYEVFVMHSLAAGIDVLILNKITTQQQSISAATRLSILIGTSGLLLSVTLLLLIMRNSLARLRRLAELLPLLASHQFSRIRALLPLHNRGLPLRDEIDLMVETVHKLSGRMEIMEQDREQARSALIWMAEHDPLTKLLNRRRFNQELKHGIENATNNNTNGALLFVDLDQFKDVNDISGHHMGDSLLQQVAEQLTKGATASSGSILGRLGGDEFAIVLPDASTEQAIDMATQVQKQVQEVIIQAHGWRHQVSASIGIVLFPQHGNNAQQLMAYADLAMYQAKEKGRGRWHLFSPEDTGRERANARVIWAERIVDALKEDRLELHFQPILEIATGEIWRAEALLRMRSTDGKLIPPGHFIPIAEETGQILTLDHWVLTHAIELMQHHPDLFLSVNLSAQAVQDSSLPGEVKRLLSTYEVPPSQLTLEVTETVAINSLSNATRLMHEIRAIGCRFALDDFGTGFASYAYLRQLPVNDVKIDGAFIRDIAYSNENQIFVRAVTEMSHGMDKKVIAEFVENADILEVLADIGIDFAQGYHIGRPVPPTQQQPGRQQLLYVSN